MNMFDIELIYALICNCFYFAVFPASFLVVFVAYMTVVLCGRVLWCNK